MLCGTTPPKQVNRKNIGESVVNAVSGIRLYFSVFYNVRVASVNYELRDGCRVSIFCLTETTTYG